MYILLFLGEGEIISGSQIGKPCHFPYLYKGVEYKGCTMEDSPSQPWCSSEKSYSSANYGYCRCPFGKTDIFIPLFIKIKCRILWLHYLNYFTYNVKYILHAIAIEWKREERIACHQPGGYFGLKYSLLEAQIQCLQDDKCRGVSNKLDCNGHNMLFNLCKAKDPLRQSLKGCMYMKPGNFMIFARKDIY